MPGLRYGKASCPRPRPAAGQPTVQAGVCVCMCVRRLSPRVGKVQLDEEDTFQKVTWEESGGLSGGMFLLELGNLVI